MGRNVLIERGQRFFGKGNANPPLAEFACWGNHAVPEFLEKVVECLGWTCDGGSHHGVTVGRLHIMLSGVRKRGGWRDFQTLQGVIEDALYFRAGYLPVGGRCRQVQIELAR